MCVGFVLASLVCVLASGQEQRLRIASYNIKFLNANVSDDRAEAIKDVIEKLDAHVIALQEIDDREALEEVFDTNEWKLVIDDDSGDNQDVAVAVRNPIELVDDNLDADDDDFLFSAASNTFFPKRRDVLNVAIKVPGVLTRE